MVILYVILCYSSRHKEVFIKVGTTSKKSIAKRYPSNSNMPYKYIVLYEERSKQTRQLREAENRVHYNLRDYKYMPKLWFSGCASECYTTEPFKVPHLKGIRESIRRVERMILE